MSCLNGWEEPLISLLPNTAVAQTNKPLRGWQDTCTFKLEVVWTFAETPYSNLCQIKCNFTNLSVIFIHMLFAGLYLKASRKLIVYCRINALSCVGRIQNARLCWFFLVPTLAASILSLCCTQNKWISILSIWWLSLSWNPFHPAGSCTS